MKKESKSSVSPLKLSQNFYNEGSAKLARRRFRDSLDLFEEALKLDKRNPKIFNKMGIASLYQNYLPEAQRYFERALDLDRDNVEAMNGLSYIYLKKGDVAEATDNICSVLKLRPHEKFARKNFKRINLAENYEIFSAVVHPAEFVALPPKFSISQQESTAKKLRLASVLIIVISMLVIFFVKYEKKNFNVPWSPANRSNSDRLYRSTSPINSNIGASLKSASSQAKSGDRELLKHGEAISILNRIKNLIRNSEFNEARFLFNRLNHSDADSMTKDMATELRKYFRKPDAKRLHWNPKADEIIKKPYLYKDVFVKWLSKAVKNVGSKYIQVIPAKFHSGFIAKNQSVKVILLTDGYKRIRQGRFVEIFGNIVGVDSSGKKGEFKIFIKNEKLKRLN